MNRLKNRPRVRYNPNAPSIRPQSTPISNRRSLISPPRRKVTEEKATEKVDEVIEEEEKAQEEPSQEEDVASSPSTEASSTTAEPDNKGLSGLLPGGRRRTNRKPGTLYRKPTTETA